MCKCQQSGFEYCEPYGEHIKIVFEPCRKYYNGYHQLTQLAKIPYRRRVGSTPETAWYNKYAACVGKNLSAWVSTGWCQVCEDCQVHHLAGDEEIFRRIHLKGKDGKARVVDLMDFLQYEEWKTNGSQHGGGDCELM
jgi:hypothetical protein